MALLNEKEINELIEERLAYLNNEDIDDTEADNIQTVITKSIMSYFPSYSVDFIIETLTKFGQAPNIVYDDNGMFAVSDCGMQQAVYDDNKIDGAITVIVEKDMWYPTIRKALWDYLKDD